ncbi:hypothetical protein VTL71DRAFT_14596 [Oculimacula yallundae]|uniref:Wax synthase domain-containing protein n=1 Tax=Oculimacula yallundae TaxID=86028 RepID=A0ABR4CK91_9HELO
MQDYLSPTQAGFFLVQWLDFYVFPPEKKPTRTKDKGRLPKTLWARIEWGLDLFINQRGTGWNWKVSGVPDGVPSRTPKWSFIHHELLKAFMWFVLADLTQYPLSSSGPEIQSNLWHETFCRRMIFVFFYPVNSYYLFNLQHSLVTAATVALGVYKPEDCSPIMGKLKNVLTIRDLWSKFWQQLWRRKIGLPFRVLTTYITIPRGTLFSKYLQLYFGFFTSAFLHLIGAWNLPPCTRHAIVDQQFFFFLQPIAITFEDFVIYIGKRAGIKKSWKTNLVGRLWTFSWFMFSLGYICAFMYNAGLFDSKPMPSMTTAAVKLLSGRVVGDGLKEL